MADETPQRTRETIEMEIAGKAWQDEEFMEALRTDPKAVIAKEYGVELPDNVELKVVEESPTELYIRIPTNPADLELSDDELESVAGGTLFGPTTITVTIPPISPLCVTVPTTVPGPGRPPGGGRHGNAVAAPVPGRRSGYLLHCELWQRERGRGWRGKDGCASVQVPSASARVAAAQTAVLETCRRGGRDPQYRPAGAAARAEYRTRPRQRELCSRAGRVG